MVFSRHADFNGCYRTIWDDKSRYLCVSVGNLTPTNDMHTQKKKKKKKKGTLKSKKQGWFCLFQQQSSIQGLAVHGSVIQQLATNQVSCNQN